MKLSTYQKDTAKTAIYPQNVPGQTFPGIDPSSAVDIIPIMYCALGLTGESGEVAEQVKKGWRNEQGISDARREKIKDELGDVLWYASQLATELDMSLEEIAQQNVEKLEARQSTGTLRSHS